MTILSSQLTDSEYQVMKARLIHPLKTIAVTLALVLWLPNTVYAQKETLEFAAIENSPIQDVAILVVDKLFKHIKQPISVERLPAKRARFYLKNGFKDGEVLRVFDYGEKNNTNVLRVPTPYYEVKTIAFVEKHNEIQINSVNDLYGHRIAKLRGHIHSSQTLQNAPKNQEIYDVETMIQAFHMLRKNRVDIALLNSFDGRATLSKLNITDILPIQTTLAKRDLFIYLHRKHHHLVKALDETVMELKANGELERMIDQAEKAVINELANPS